MYCYVKKIIQNYFVLHINLLDIANIKNTKISTATIVEPTGVPANIDMSIPIVEQTTESTAAQIVTDLKLLKILIADIEGNITNAEISSEPTKFIANTITTAITIPITKLYISTFVPVAFAKFSSNVMLKILL